jgi:Flp pilus assembly protein TadG
VPSAKHQHRRRAILASERGQALLEAAFTLPLVLLVSISILEFGRAYQTAQIVTNAAREGARVAIVANTSDEDIETRVKDYLESGQLVEPEELEIEIDRDVNIAAGGATATGSRITVRFPFSFMVLNGIANLVKNGSTTGNPITITAVAQMRNES